MKIFLLAILEIVSSADVDLEISDFQFLTDELRSRAAYVLPSDKYNVLTREQMQNMLPQDGEEMERLMQSTALELGKAVGAEFVTESRIGVFDEQLSLTVTLYETATGKFLGSFTGNGNNAKVLLDVIRAKAEQLFEKILPPVQHSPTLPLPPPEIPRQPPSFRLGVAAKAGLAKTAAKDGGSGMAYSVGLTVVKNFGFVDFIPELLFSGDEFKLGEKQVSNLNIEIPIMARIAVMDILGISAGAVAGFPISSNIEGEPVKDRVKAGVAAIGGLSYIIDESFSAGIFYEKYFNETFASIKASNTDKILCGLTYLF